MRTAFAAAWLALLLLLAGSAPPRARAVDSPVDHQQALFDSLRTEAAHLHLKHADTIAQYSYSLPHALAAHSLAQREQQLARQRRRHHHNDVEQDDDDDGADYDADNADTIGVVDLYNDGNTRYYTVLSVGSPPTLVAAQVDTGSSDLWLAADKWDGALPSVSASFNSTGRNFSMHYTDGSSVSGLQGTDRVELAGFVGAHTAVSVGYEVSEDAAAPPLAGVLAMGWSALATGKAPTFWQAADVDVFSLFLSSPNVDDPDVWGGRLMLGGVDPALYTGPIHYVPVLHPNIAWTVPLSGLSVGSTSIPLSAPSSPSPSKRRSLHSRSSSSGSGSSSPRPIAALLDSGTTLISAPPALAEAFYDAVPGARPLAKVSGFYEYPCNTTLDVGVHFGASARFAIPEAVFVKARNERPGQKVDAVEYCIGSLFGNGSNDTDFMILGDTFLRSVISVFDGKRGAVGFAALASGVPTTGPSYSLSPNATGGKRYVGKPGAGLGGGGGGGWLTPGAGIGMASGSRAGARLWRSPLPGLGLGLGPSILGGDGGGEAASAVLASCAGVGLLSLLVLAGLG